MNCWPNTWHILRQQHLDHNISFKKNKWISQVTTKLLMHDINHQLIEIPFKTWKMGWFIIIKLQHCINIDLVNGQLLRPYHTQTDRSNLISTYTVTEMYQASIGPKGKFGVGEGVKSPDQRWGERVGEK